MKSQFCFTHDGHVNYWFKGSTCFACQRQLGWHYGVAPRDGGMAVVDLETNETVEMFETEDDALWAVSKLERKYA
jgi:hypothetical protein